MKIAFWSNVNEICNVSANLAAISVASVIRYPYSVIVLENRLCNNNLGKAFLRDTQVNFICEAGTNYYDGGGIEGLIRKIYRENFSSDMIKSYLKVIHKHLFYIPQSRVIHNEIFEYEFDHCIHSLFSVMEEYADICFIDTASKGSLSTKTILDEADLIVVNLCQREGILEDFFTNYSSLIDKSLFVFSNYDNRAILNNKNIADRYHLSIDNILVIPNNISYQNAFSNGSVVDFIVRNYSCLRENPNYRFIQAIKKAANIVIKKAENMVKQKEIILCGR